MHLMFLSLFMKLLDLLSATVDHQNENDRANIRMWLKKIDQKLLDFKSVENLTIDLTQRHASSIGAPQSTITSFFASSNKKVSSEQVSVSTFSLHTSSSSTCIAFIEVRQDTNSGRWIILGRSAFSAQKEEDGRQ